MQTHTAKIQNTGSNAAAHRTPQLKRSHTAAPAFVDNRPMAAVQTKSCGMLQRRADKQAPVLQAKTAQLVNRLTMHTAPLDTRLAGGGRGSGVNTGTEIATLIRDNVTQDLIDSRTALRGSISVRAAAHNPDAAHLARLRDERGWLTQLNTALATYDAAQTARAEAYSRLMRTGRSPAPAPSPGGGSALPSGAGWGGARRVAATPAPAPAPTTTSTTTTTATSTSSTTVPTT